MVNDAVVLDHNIGTSLEEIRDQGRDLFWAAFVDKRGEPSGIREQDYDFGEVTRLPMDVSNVVEVGVLLTAVHPQKAPKATSPTYEMRFAVQKQHGLPEKALGRWVLNHAYSQRVAVIDKAVVRQLKPGGYLSLHQSLFYLLGCWQ